MYGAYRVIGRIVNNESVPAFTASSPSKLIEERRGQMYHPLLTGTDPLRIVAAEHLAEVRATPSATTHSRTDTIPVFIKNAGLDSSSTVPGVEPGWTQCPCSKHTASLAYSVCNRSGFR
jgi:hypothetical protein